jgi:hypothetical protein
MDGGNFRYASVISIQAADEEALSSFRNEPRWRFDFFSVFLLFGFLLLGFLLFGMVRVGIQRHLVFQSVNQIGSGSFHF